MNVSECLLELVSVNVSYYMYISVTALDEVGLLPGSYSWSCNFHLSILLTPLVSEFYLVLFRSSES